MGRARALEVITDPVVTAVLPDGSEALRPGCYEISIGGSQPEPRSEALTGQKAAVLKAEFPG